MALVAVQWLLFGHLISLNGIVCLLSLTGSALSNKSQSLPYATSEKVSNVLRDVLNQESLVRLSVVQKIQRLMMDAMENKNITETVLKRLDNISKTFHALETRQQEMEEENARLNEELKTMRSTVGKMKNLTSDNIQRLDEKEISLLGKQTSSLQNKIDELTLENTEIKAQLDNFIKTNKTISETGAKFVQINHEIEQIKETELGTLKNDTLLLMQNYVGLSQENESMQNKLFQMNKTIYENRNADDFNTRLQVVEGNFMTFSAFVNNTIGRILEDQDNATKKLMRISEQLSERLLTPSIAFYTYMSKNTQPLSVQYPLRFDIVKTNIGNGYHSARGTFIVPETGTYVFTWTIRVNSGNYRHSTQLLVNTDEQRIIHTHSASGADIEGTGIVVVQVNAGDDVFVRTHGSWNNGPVLSDAAGRSSFAGWKLY